MAGPPEREEEASLEEQLRHLLGEPVPEKEKEVPPEVKSERAEASGTETLPGAHVGAVGKVTEKHPPSRPPGGKKVISLNLEGPNIRLVTFSGRKITGWTSLPFNPGFVRGNMVVHPEELGQVIASLFRSWKLKGTLVCAFPGQGTISRLLSLPLVKKSLTPQIVHREARRLLTYHPETQYLYWQTIPYRTGVSRIYVLTVPKEPLLSLINTFQKAGKRLSRVELKLHALLRCLPSPTGVLAHCEPFSLEVAIVVDYLPMLMRSIYLGEEVLPEDQAVDRAVGEISATISFYSEGYREAPLPDDAPVYLSGSISESRRLSQELASATGHPVAPLDSPLEVPPEFPVSLFLVNIGLFLGTER